LYFILPISALIQLQQCNPSLSILLSIKPKPTSEYI
jgi:hypothetical protein